MLLCLNCYELFDEKCLDFDYNRDYNWCPKLDCGGDLIQVDELFVPIIIELNKKGYMTHYCCSGHIHEGHCGGISSYIWFYPDNNVKDIIKNNLPKNYKFDYGNDGGVDINRIFNSKLPKDKLLQEVCKNAIEMIKWAKKLPKLY